VIFYTRRDKTGVIRQLVAEGWEISTEDRVQLPPYITEHIGRFGVYATDVLLLRFMRNTPKSAVEGSKPLSQCLRPRNRRGVEGAPAVHYQCG